MPFDPPSAPRFVEAEAVASTGVRISWLAPQDTGGSDITGYEHQVLYEDMAPEPFRATRSFTEHIVRGLAEGHRYGFALRARTAAGVGPSTVPVYAVPQRPALTLARPGELLPVEDLYRQAFITRLAGRDCRIRVWYQPSDGGWYGSLEVPANTPVVTARRVAVNAGLLDGVLGVLPGNIVCRARDDSSEARDPDLFAWGRGTHGLYWEPD